MDTKHVTTGVTLKGATTGEIEATFSTFYPHVDRDGDTTMPSAFTDGQAVGMVWAHQWDRIIGSGRVRVESSRAVFSGKLFLDTEAGREAYATLKNLGPLAEYSWGFRILESDYQQIEGKRVRVIKRAELFEVSPVLIGAAGRGASYTMSLKGDRRPLTAAERAEMQRLTNAALVAESRDLLTRGAPMATPLDPRAVLAEARATLARTG